MTHLWLVNTYRPLNSPCVWEGPWQSHTAPTPPPQRQPRFSVPRSCSPASMCSSPLLTHVLTSAEIRFTEHSAFRKPGVRSGASQFNGAHYGNQLNAEERDKFELFTTPSTRDPRKPTLMGAPLRPHSVTQPSLSAAVTNLRRERCLFAWRSSPRGLGA